MASVMASDGRRWVILMVTMTFGGQRCLVVQSWKRQALLSDAFAVVWWSRVGNVKLLLSNAFAVAAPSDSSQDKQNVKSLQKTTSPVRTLGSFSMKTIP